MPKEDFTRYGGGLANVLCLIFADIKYNLFSINSSNDEFIFSFEDDDFVTETHVER